MLPPNSPAFVATAVETTPPLPARVLYPGQSWMKVLIGALLFWIPQQV